MSPTHDLQFKGGDPGAVQNGNFINYYQFHPPDERIKLLPNNIWESAESCVALDIGCNAGNLTVALKEYLTEYVSRNTSVLGVDIDPLLIERARCYSKDVTFKCIDIMNESARTSVISEYLKDNKVNKFSVVLCFSTTMWIHLNHGDLGLKSFLKYICSISDMVVVEPQPWKCYKTAVKRMKRNNYTFPAYMDLKFRETVETDIENILSNDCKMVKVSESERTMWNRKLLIFKH